MAGNPLASLPGLPQRPSLARSSASETRLTQPGIEGARSRKLNSAPTATFRINVWTFATKRKLFISAGSRIALKHLISSGEKWRFYQRREESSHFLGKASIIEADKMCQGRWHSCGGCRHPREQFVECCFLSGL